MQISRLVLRMLCMHGTSFVRSLKMNGMHRTHSGHACLDLLSLVI